MLPTDYTTLGTAVQTYLSRGDIGVASGNLDYLITETEQELNARLRVRRMLTAITPTVSSAGVVTLPTGFGGWKRFQVRDGTSERDLELKGAEQLTEISSLYGQAGVPQAVITLGATSQIWPYTDGVYTFAALHYLRVPNLTGSATTNWVITNFPAAYLFGCLAAAASFSTQQDERFPMWAKRFDRVIDQIIAEDAFDLDARTHATLGLDTSLFSGGGDSNIRAGN